MFLYFPTAMAVFSVTVDQESLTTTCTHLSRHYFVDRIPNEPCPYLKVAAARFLQHLEGFVHTALGPNYFGFYYH
jgi:hypothetical protein